jgi:hypothetical protein
MQKQLSFSHSSKHWTVWSRNTGPLYDQYEMMSLLACDYSAIWSATKSPTHRSRNQQTIRPFVDPLWLLSVSDYTDFSWTTLSDSWCQSSPYSGFISFSTWTAYKESQRKYYQILCSTNVRKLSYSQKHEIYTN